VSSIAIPLASTWVAQSVAVGAAIACSVTAYALLVRRARRAPGGRSVGAGHVVFFAAGIALLVVTAAPPLAPLSDELLSAHMVQHVVLADIAPALFVLALRSPLLPLGLPPAALRAVARGGVLGPILAVLTRPVVALGLWIAAQWLWSVPALMGATTQHDALHLLQHATLFYTGLLLWWVVVDPLPRERRRPGMGRLAVLGASRAATAAICLPLTFMGTTFYGRFVETTAARGLDPLTDQRLAGAAMCFLEFFVFGLAFAVVFIDALNREERADALARRAAGELP